VILGANNISKDSTEAWVEKSIEKIYKHPLFDKFLKSAYYDVAVLGKLLVLLYLKKESER
jgi:hypothetical protein